MAVHLEDDRGHCEHEAGDKLRPGANKSELQRALEAPWFFALSVPCRIPFQDRLSSAVDFSDPLLGLGTAPITYPLRHINSRWERPPRNKREIKGQIETRLKQRLSQRMRRDDHPGPWE
jgi:hypothetical protein